MAAVRSMKTSGLLALVAFIILDLQGAAAQNSTCTYSSTPPWATAVIVMLAIALATYLLGCCMVPFCSGLCKKRDDCQSGCTFGK